MNDALQLLATLPVWLVIFLFSTTCHEAAHALAAKLGGDRTAEAGGQVSLDPLPHIRRHPVGMVVFPLLSFIINGGGWMIGWASAPYDAAWAARHPKRAAWMSAAGPAANLMLVIIAGLAIRGGMMAGWFEAPRAPSTEAIVALAKDGGGSELLALGLSVLFSLNLLLFSFNLLPLPPLDGSGVIGLFLTDDLFRKFQALFADPSISIMGLIVAWQVFGQAWSSIFVTALQLLYPEYGYSVSS